MPLAFSSIQAIITSSWWGHSSRTSFAGTPDQPRWEKPYPRTQQYCSHILMPAFFFSHHNIIPLKIFLSGNCNPGSRAHIHPPHPSRARYCTQYGHKCDQHSSSRPKLLWQLQNCVWLYSNIIFRRQMPLDSSPNFEPCPPLLHNPKPISSQTMNPTQGRVRTCPSLPSTVQKLSNHLFVRCTWVQVGAWCSVPYIQVVWKIPLCSSQVASVYSAFFGQVQDLAFLPGAEAFVSAAEVVRRNSTDKGIMVWDFRSTAILSNQIYQVFIFSKSIMFNSVHSTISPVLIIIEGLRRREAYVPISL